MKVRNLANSSIRNKMLFGFSIIILIFGIVALINYYQINKINSLREQVIPLTSHISSLQDLAISLESLEKNTDKIFMVGYKEDEEKSYEDIEKMLDIIKFLKGTFDKSSNEKLLKIEEQLNEIKKKIKQIANLEPNAINAKTINEERLLIYQQIDSLRNVQRELLYEVTTELISNVQSQKKIIDKIIQQALILSLFSVVLGTLISILIANSISRPIIRLKNASIEIGRGNLDTKIDMDSTDELGQLATAFKNMTMDLKKSTISRNYLDNNGSLIVTDYDGKISNINKKTCQMLEYKEEELIGHSIDIIFQNENVSFEKSSFKEIIQKEFITNIEKNYIAKNGAIIPMLFSSSIMRNETGNVTGIICVALELTERKKIEEKITILNKDLQCQAVELNAINKELEAFSYSVSHDLRAPLRTIDGFSQAILEDYADKFDEEGKDYLRRVRAASQRMAQLIDDMQKLPRLTRSTMNLEKVDISAIVKNICAELCTTQPERKVEFIIAQGITANADARLLCVALENLLRNAWKFTGNRTNTRIEFGVAQIDGEKSYFITDNGAGFDMAYANKLFGAFQRLHSSTEFPGTGIGLAIVQRIIHRHGGKVWAKGEIEKGATFYFTLGSAQNKGGRI